MLLSVLVQRVAYSELSVAKLSAKKHQMYAELCLSNNVADWGAEL